MKNHLQRIFPGDSEMATRMRQFDWTKSTVGPVEQWPQSLKTALSICLGSKFPMFVWWGKELTVFYNDAYIPFASKKHPQFIGRPAREQWAEIWDKLFPLTEQVFKTGTATWAESMQLFMTRNGFLEETYFTFSYSPIHDETGAVGGIINPCQETTKRILGERRLKTLRDLGIEKVATITELGKIATQVFEKNSNDIPFSLIYTIRDGKAALIGSSGIQPSSSAIKEIHDLSSTQNDIWCLKEVYKEKKPMLIENLRKSLQWGEGPDSAYVLPIELAGNTFPVGFLILGISPRLAFDTLYQDFFGLLAKQLTTQIFNANALQEERKRTEALAEIDRAKTTFFSNVSHEFRTPLTLMISPLEEVLKSTLPESCREQLSMVHRNSLRLLKLVNTLLDFARIESARIQASYEPTDLAKLTSELVSTFHPIITKANMRLKTDCPSLAEPVFVDREMWEKIVLNLLSNAFKFTLEGEISVQLQQNKKLTELVVSDTGVGIPKEELPHMFERFHRIPNSRSRTHEGTGIGLALVHELVKCHSGTISIESILGKGTKFIVRIPNGSDHLSQERIKAQKSIDHAAANSNLYIEETQNWLPQIKATSTLKAVPASNLSARILIADDNPDMRQYFQELLSQKWNLTVVTNGQEALNAATENPPDLILSDVMMPEMDGFELLRQLRNNPRTREIPIILLSGRAGEESRIEGVEKGADDYLVKPFSTRELFARVQTHLDLAKQRNEAARVLKEAKEDLEIRVKQRTADLARSNLELEQFAGVAAHDLRAPIRSMRGWIEILDLLVPKPRSKEFDQAIEFVMFNTKKAETLINDLLDITRVNVSEDKFEWTDLNHVLENIEQVLKPEIETCQASIIYDTLPKIFCHPTLLESVLNNLIRNALVYRQKDKIPKIAIKCIEGKDAFLFSVQDNGIGIKQEYLKRIFEMFKRLHSEKEYPGNGIGLAFCKKVVELSGGKIWAESVVGEGSTFFFTYPKENLK